MNNLLFSQDQHEVAAELTKSFVERYHAQLSDRPVFPEVDRAAIRALMNSPLPKESQPLTEIYRELEEVIVPNSTHTAHPRFASYVLPSPNSLSPYADQVSSVLNQNCNLWHLSPAANAVEQTVVRWFADLFKFPETAGGLISSGGSMASLIALTAARDHKLGVNARTSGLQNGNGTLVAYTSEQTHSCMQKAMSILGVGTENLRKIPVDSEFRIRLDLLSAAIEEDKRFGKVPFCVIGNAGTIMTGAFDPIEELSNICRREEMWLHVDGAYGALAVISKRYESTLTAIGLADSVALDPHKFLFCPLEAGCVLVRNRETLRHSFHSHPDYLTMSEDPDFIDYANYGPQLSRSFKALKVWWSLKHVGLDGYAETIDRMVDLAFYMGDQINKRAELLLLSPVTFNCVCFRVNGLSDNENIRVLNALVDSGDAFLGPAMVNGVSGLRACFMNLRMTKDDVDQILDAVIKYSS